MADSRFASGLLWSLSSAFLWATTFVAARYLLDDNRIDFLTFTAARYILGGAVLLLWGLFTARKRVLSVCRADFVRLAILGLIGITAQGLLLFAGLTQTTAINASMVMQLNPLIILIGGVFIGQRVTLRNIAGLVVSLFGCMVVVEVMKSGGFSYSPDHVAGDFLVLLAASCWATYCVAGKSVVQRLGGFVSTVWTMSFAGLQLAVIWFVSVIFCGVNYTCPSIGPDWLVVLYVAVFPSAVAFLAFYKALNRLPLPLLNIMQYLTPVFTIALAWIFIGERISLLRIAGCGMVLLGLWVSGIIRAGK